MRDAIDFAIITALPVERDAVLDQLGDATVARDERDPITYYRARLALPSGASYNVIVAMLAGMGNTEAAVTTTRLIERWHPASVLMVGIGAGVRGEVGLGDVVVSEFSHYYELAKLTVDGEQRRAQQYPSDPLLLDRARSLVDQGWWTGMPAARPDAATTRPAAVFGPVASGEKVVADLTTIGQLKKDCPKLKALAMEGAGVARAAASAYDRPRFVEIRGISDFAGPDKTDEWHAYAACAAAAFALALLRTAPTLPGATTARSLLGPRHNLPAQLNPLVGRQRELDDVGKLLATSRLVTLVGPGGVGKTRLSLEAARTEIDRFDHGVWFVELAPLAEPGLVPQAVAHALDVQEVGSKSAADVVLESVRDKSLLLVFDNCEQVIGACANLAARLLAAAPALAILATSREPLRIPGEHVYHVPTLAVPAERGSPTPEALAENDSVRLFVERAAAAQPGFALSATNAVAIAEICRRLDGIPLAIELAAARVRALPPDGIAARLSDRFRLLTTGSRNALPRQQTLRALIDWSYDLLNVTERDLFESLSVFAGGWTLEAAEAVCISDLVSDLDVLDLLTALTDKSLVVASAEHEEPRYSMLESIRQYSREKLNGAPHMNRIFDQHLGFFGSLAKTAETQLQGSGQIQWLARLDAEQDNLRAAMAWALHAHGDKALELAAALGRFWELRGQYTEGRSELERALAAAPSDLDAGRAAALQASGVLAIRQRDYSSADRQLRAALALARARGDAKGIARSLVQQGLLNYVRSDYDRALDALDEGLDFALQVRDAASIDLALGVYGGIAYVRGDAAMARDYFDAGLRRAREAGDQVTEALVLNNLGNVSALIGEFDLAREYYLESLRVKRKLGVKAHLTNTLVGLGEVARRLGNLPSAREYYSEALEISTALNDGYQRAYALEGMGMTYVSEGRSGPARGLLRQSLELRLAIGDKEGVASSIESLGSAVLGEGNVGLALTLLSFVDAERRRIGVDLMPAERVEYERNVALARAELGETEASARWSEGQAQLLSAAIACATAAET